MNNKIIVVGADYSSLTAAALIAAKGFDVTVFEKKSEHELDYKRAETFNPDLLEITGLGLPDRDKWISCYAPMIYSPSLSKSFKRQVPENKLDIKMNSRDLFEHIIKFAKKNGVKFVFDCKATQAIMLGDRVVGIKTEKGDFLAQLVIDCAGLNSPLRRSLNINCNIEKNITNDELTFNYHARFNNPQASNVKEKGRIFLCPAEQKAIARIEAFDDFTDVYLTFFEPCSKSQIKSLLNFLKSFNPCVGDEFIYGGIVRKAAAREPLGQTACAGYAAIGQAAFMSNPLTGEGVTEGLKAAKLLAKAVGRDRHRLFNKKSLWQYQADYFKVAGSNIAMLSCVKNIILSLSFSELDEIFESEILSSRDLSADKDRPFSSINLDSILQKAQKLKNRPSLFKKVSLAASKIMKSTAVCAAIPQTFNDYTTPFWLKGYEKTFKK